MTTASAPLHGGYEFTEADRVRKARLMHSMDQHALADATGLSRQTISSIETDGPMRKSSRKLIAMALGVSPQWLETGTLDSRDNDGMPGSADDGPSTTTGYSSRRLHRFDRRARKPEITPRPDVYLLPLKKAA